MKGYIRDKTNLIPPFEKGGQGGLEQRLLLSVRFYFQMMQNYSDDTIYTD
jgi:hypothetical protein